ncbi:uncharacterized protein LOC124445231 [Xenia sp. Carnegie-2017]|uniref:uncharacterized protein LOC124445231 n=1 Tax=Xenia sp. Carnegie-2017 TaxID=2897299 RepID=UPI001F032F0E|nr:uncharacterized protein LOC124445231 [Xenia sp. Carnegie-2017]
MFIVVLFGGILNTYVSKILFLDSQQELFNPDCRNINLIENIKKRCKCRDKDMIDLADESGLVKSMNERPSEQLASEYLECRKTYVLVEVKRRLEGASGHLFKSYKPLLNGLDESNPDFIAKIASQNRAAANKGNKSPKHNSSNRQAKGNPKVHKNLSATVSVSSTTRSKSIMYKKRP